MYARILSVYQTYYVNIYKYNNCYNLDLPAFLAFLNKCISHIAQKRAPISKSAVTDISFSHLLHIHPFSTHPVFFFLFGKCRGFWYYIAKRMPPVGQQQDYALWGKASCCSGEALIWQSKFWPQHCQVPVCVPSLSGYYLGYSELPICFHRHYRKTEWVENSFPIHRNTCMYRYI